jgi:hypothetical protein
MKISSRSALALDPWQRRSGLMLLALLVTACVAGCVADPGAARAAVPPSDPRALAADLNARLDALQHQSEPASDDVIASLERALREQREKRARAVVAAGTTAVIPSGAAAGVAAPTVPMKVVPAPAPVAAASTPTKPVHLTKAQARAASAAAARTAVAAKPAATAVAPVPAPAAEVEVAAGATPLPPLRPVDPVPPPTFVHTSAATVAGPIRTPMSRTAESHMPVDELYGRARALEEQLQVIPAIGLYREASQRGHAPSSQRLMELYADGAPGVARDYRVAVFFKERAVQQGASFDPVWRR